MAVLIVLVVVWGRPIGAADVAELIGASAGHMVAPLILLNHELALAALAIVKVPLKELHLVSVAVPLVPTQKALRTKLRLAFVANHNPLERTADESFAVLLWTQFYVWVVGRNVKLVQFSVRFLHVGG